MKFILQVLQVISYLILSQANQHHGQSTIYGTIYIWIFGSQYIIGQLKQAQAMSELS